jgi:2',3'-cyclic-nucleotide 2'-phosphodiesterase (5'-nucleotidase family)
MTNFAIATPGDALSEVRPRVAAAPTELDRAASLLLASAGVMRRAAEAPGSASAIAAALGPMEAALGELEQAADAMETVARERLEKATALLAGRWTHVNAARTAHEIEDLARALANARLACQTARECAGPILAELAAL